MTVAERRKGKHISSRCFKNGKARNMSDGVHSKVRGMYLRRRDVLALTGGCIDEDTKLR